MAAVIPTQQYGNLQPSFDVEANTHDEAVAIGLRQIKEIWDRTATKPLEVRELDNLPRLRGEPLRCWASGTRVYFDPETHTYDSGDGKRWLSGSTFADQYRPEFQSEIIAGKMAAKYDVDASRILEMWSLNAHASSTFGTSVHAALQLRGEFEELSRAVKEGALDSALTKNPVLRPIVEAFYEGREGEVAKYEVFVADPVRRHCGLIDRLVIEPDGVYVEDYKTNTDLDKATTIQAPFRDAVDNTKLGGYWLQLSFYARIIQSHGKPVKGLRIHHLNGGLWDTYEHEVVSLEPAL